MDTGLARFKIVKRHGETTGSQADEGTPLEPPLSPASSIGLPPCYDYKRLQQGYFSPPKKDAQVKEAGSMFKKFLDVDVMKSVADLNCKPKPRLVGVRQDIAKILFLPFHRDFWIKLITPTEWAFFTTMYLLEILCCYLYTTKGEQGSILGDVSASEVYFPPMLLLLMGLVFGRIPTVVQKMGVSKEREEEREDEDVDTSISSESETEEDVNVDNNESEQDEQRSSSFLHASSSTGSLDKDVCSDLGGTDCGDTVRIDTINVLLWGDDTTIRKTAAEVLLSEHCGGKKNQPYKFTMSVMQVRNAILRKVDTTDTEKHAQWIDIPFWTALLFSVLPTLHRVFMMRDPLAGFVLQSAEAITTLDISELSPFTGFNRTNSVCDIAFADPMPSVLQVLATIFLHPSTSAAPLRQSAVPAFVALLSAVSVFVLVRKMVTHLTHAERTYHKRYLYAKFFSALTSLRRSQRYNLPHFRLKNVENVMAWLTLRGSRAWLRLEPQEIAADSVVSLTFQSFLFTVAVVGMLVVQEATEAKRNKGALRVDTFSEVMHGQIFLVSMVLSYYLLHYMMTGTSINHKYVIQACCSQNRSTYTCAWWLCQGGLTLV
eukprot:TRINITY_DN1471_c1_g2_i2.p1 TRINITY_DN1471_c1_g2~~TRINITY_DN1471_c1_g2_i2.p1  ORF type:complete len:601 (+),score=140.87 TRINITY_DN1471_c1_g2_i2:46-1848(+)